MPKRQETLDLERLRDHLRDEVFRSKTRHRVGAEVEAIGVVGGVEWPEEPVAQAAAARLWERLAGGGASEEGLPWDGGRLTREPGGQWEYSGPPREGSAEAAVGAWRAFGRVERAARGVGLALHPVGFHPWATVEQTGMQATGRRYVAMQTYLDRIGPYGRRMMRLTASVQVSVDCGDDPRERDERFELGLRIAPLMAAMFANSGVEEGRVARVPGLRHEAWLKLDPRRTGFPRLFLEDPGVDAITAYLDFATQAPVMYMRTEEGPFHVPDPELTFAGWMEKGERGGYPDLGDWVTHLSTLFPFVRARGSLEVRSSDAPGRAWIGVPMIVAGVGLSHPEARRSLLGLLRPFHAELSDLSIAAAERGLGDGRLLELSREAFRMVRTHTEGVAQRWLRAYESRYLEEGISPGDELRGRIGGTGRLNWWDFEELERERRGWLASPRFRHAGGKAAVVEDSAK